MSLFGQSRPAPAGLSINTGSANSLFGSNNTSSVPQAASGGLFGSTPAAASKPSLFGATATAAPSAGTLFGAATSTPAQGGSTFNTAAPSRAGTLFGGTAATGQSGGLFGTASTTTQPQQQPAAQPSLFGQSTAAQGGGGGLFGNTAQLQQQPQQQQSGGLFGNAAASQPQQSSLFGQAPQAQTGGMFGSSLGGQQAQVQLGQTQKQPGSLFANQSTQQNPQRPVFAASLNNSTQPAQQPQRSTFAASIGQYTAAAQSVPGVRIDLSNIKPTTRFEELHDSLQTEIEQLDTFIQRQIRYADECSPLLKKIDQLSATVPADVEYCERKLQAAQDSLEADAAAIDASKRVVRTDAEDARRSFKAIHSLRMPAQYQAAGLWNASGPTPGALNDGETVDSEKDSADLVAYFSAQADEMATKLDSFKKNLQEVETYLWNVEGNITRQLQDARAGKSGDGAMVPRSADEKVRELAGVLREFEGGILSVAGNVGGARETVQEVMLNGNTRWARR